jgi:hypothetical protein
MEDFPPRPGPVWRIIENTIKESDYYLLIVAARYGTIFPGEDISYTEKEFFFAKENGIPCIVLLKSGIRRLSKEIRSFRNSVSINVTPGHWQDETELCSLAISALHDAEENSPALGWVRGTRQRQDGDSATPEQRHPDALKQDIPSAIQFEGELTISYRIDHATKAYVIGGGCPSPRPSEYEREISVAWEEVFRSIGKKIYDDVSCYEKTLRHTLKKLCLDKDKCWISEHFPESNTFKIDLAHECFQKIKDKFRGMGLIEPNPNGTPDSPSWRLTEKGKGYIMPNSMS